MITIDDIMKRYDSSYVRSLAEDEGDTGEEWQDRINALIASAEAEVKNMLSLQYSEEELENNDAIKAICVALTMYALEGRRAGRHTQAVTNDYNQARAQLQMLREGEMKLHNVPQLLPSVSPEEPGHDYLGSGFFDGLPGVDEEWQT